MSELFYRIAVKVLVSSLQAKVSRPYLESGYILLRLRSDNSAGHRLQSR